MQSFSKPAPVIVAPVVVTHSSGGELASINKITIPETLIPEKKIDITDTTKDTIVVEPKIIENLPKPKIEVKNKPIKIYKKIVKNKITPINQKENVSNISSLTASAANFNDNSNQESKNNPIITSIKSIWHWFGYKLGF